MRARSSTEAGGEIVGERCLPIGDTDVDRIVAEVAARRPNFILSNMLGPSNHAFLRAMRELGRRDPAFRPERCPVVSCDLTECELPEIGFGVADGQLAAASYFDSLDTSANRALKAQVASAIRLRAPGLELFRNQLRDGPPLRGGREPVAERDDPVKVRAALAGLETPSPLGPLRIDPATNHANLPFLLGRISGADFVILQSRPAAVGGPVSHPQADYRPAAQRAAAAQGRLMKETLSFLGQRAMILHRPGDTTDRLVRQCALLGLRVEARWRPLRAVEDVDIVLVDADEGWDGLLPWTPAEKPAPLVALLASEAPGRIAWALDQGADALIAKPVTASAVYPALVMATRRHAEARQLNERIAKARRARAAAAARACRRADLDGRGWLRRERGLWPSAPRGHADAADP